jgi:PAS domain-containing protein
MTNRKMNIKPYLAGAAILLCVVAAGIFGVFHLVRYEQQRDLDNWQLTLAVVADSRAAEIMRWSEGRFAVLRELAANGSLQLYAQQLLSNPALKQETEAVQLSYLRNLIQTTGQRSGFYDDPRSAMPAPANIAFAADNGLALLAADGALITATPGVAPPDATLKEAIARVKGTASHLFCDIRLNENHQPIAAFLVPVFPLQNPAVGQQPIAVLYGFTNAATSLFKILDHRSLATKTAETVLVRLDGNLITYVSPLADGTTPLTLQLAANADKLAAASALRSPGRFDQGLDHAGSRCLFTSRVLSGLNMLLVQKISYDEALAESQRHQRFLFVALLMALLLGAALMVAAWWHGSSVKERQTARDLLDKSRQLEAQTTLLNAINDNMTDFILLLDHQACLVFANKPLAGLLETSADALPGKSLANIFGPDAGRTLRELVKSAASGRRMIAREIAFEIKGAYHLFLATCLPVGYESKGHDTVLLSLHDITLLQEAQIKKERLMKQIVGALMRAIDLHDPHSANHSAKTALVATAVGRAMELPDDMLATIETAATLCNLGKLTLPREILVKSGELTPAEQAAVQGETAAAAAILADIEFAGPVVETICQKNEYLDGSGYPQGLSGEAILLSGRILAAANAFVAMTSPRAYRDRLSAGMAMNQLLAAADSRYDRHVIAALFHVVENEIDLSAVDRSGS